MDIKTCLIIGKTSDFKSEKVKMLAEKGGEPGYLDSCDLGEEYGSSEYGESLILTNNDMLMLFRDGSDQVYTGAVLEQRLEFLENYAAVAVPVDPIWGIKSTGDPVAFFKTYLSDISELHREYQVPYFEKEAEAYNILLKRSLTSKQYQKFAELFVLGCQDTNLPDDIVAIGLAATLFGSLLLGRAGDDPNGLVRMYDDCLAIASADRKRSFMNKLKALRGDVMMEKVRLKLSASKMMVKEGDVLNIPAIKKAAKGNKVTVIFGWTSWCPYCIEIMPTVNDMASKMRKKGAGVVGLIDEKDDPKEIARHRKEKQISWKDISLSESDSVTLPDGRPFFVVVDKRGVVKKVIVGVNPGWEKQLEQAMSF